VNIVDTIDGARRAFELTGRGCLVRLGEDEPTYATVTEIAARLEPHRDATMLLTAVSEAVERYDQPSRVPQTSTFRARATRYSARTPRLVLPRRSEADHCQKWPMVEP
jgi:hypothetical protein